MRFTKAVFDRGFFLVLVTLTPKNAVGSYKKYGNFSVFLKKIRVKLCNYQYSTMVMKK